MTKKLKGLGDMKIKKLKAREADYSGPGAKIQTREVRNLPEVAKWFTKAFMPTLRRRKKWEKAFRLLGDHRKDFREMFGPVSFCYHGSHYFHSHLLEVEYGGESAQILIMTATEHGTAYEAVVSRDGNLIPCVPYVIIHFLEWLQEQLPSES